MKQKFVKILAICCLISVAVLSPAYCHGEGVVNNTTKAQDVPSRTELENLKKRIENCHNVVITCHVAPDGDAIGSSLALMHTLKNIGKNAKVVTPDTINNSLKFLPGVKDVVAYSTESNLAKKIVADADLIFCLDYNTLSRIGKLAQAVKDSKAEKVMIDHHLNPENICGLTISYPDMSSTCELLYNSIVGAGYSDKIDQTVAECLYTGIITDTGNFAYASDSPNLYFVVADLLSSGIDKNKIYNAAMNTSTAERLKFMGYVLLEKIEVFPEAHTALITLSKDELKRFHYKDGDTTGFANIPLQIPGVEWTVFMREDADCIKVSARSIGDFAVNTICKEYFNGGGHKNAAGGSLNGSLQDARNLFMKVKDDIQKSFYGNER